MIRIQKLHLDQLAMLHFMLTQHLLRSPLIMKIHYNTKQLHLVLVSSTLKIRLVFHNILLTLQCSHCLYSQLALMESVYNHILILNLHLIS